MLFKALVLRNLLLAQRKLFIAKMHLLFKIGLLNFFLTICGTVVNKTMGQGPVFGVFVK